MSGQRILIVEDEPAIAESLDYALSREGFQTQIAPRLLKAEHTRSWPALIVLDLMLPDGDGLDWIRKLRRSGQRTPIIVLSSREAESDRVTALECGADDYVTKPFSPREMVARVRAVLRRLQEPNTVQGGLRLDPAARTAHIQRQDVELTRVEFDLLAELVQRPGEVQSRSELIDRVWGDGFAITDRTVDSHIKSLRRKLAEAGADNGWIETVRGVGFRLSTEALGDEAAETHGPAEVREGVEMDDAAETREPAPASSAPMGKP